MTNANDQLALATTALVDLHNGYPHKEIAAAQGLGLTTLITELVDAQRSSGYDDEGAWDIEGTRHIPVAATTRPSGLLAKFLALLDAADAVKVDGGPLLTSWDISETTGARDNQIVRFAWESEGLCFSAILTEEGIAQGTYNAATGEFIVEDMEGETTTVVLHALSALKLAD